MFTNYTPLCNLDISSFKENRFQNESQLMTIDVMNFQIGLIDGKNLSFCVPDFVCQ